MMNMKDDVEINFVESDQSTPAAAVQGIVEKTVDEVLERNGQTGVEITGEAESVVHLAESTAGIMEDLGTDIHQVDMTCLLQLRE